MSDREKGLTTGQRSLSAEPQAVANVLPVTQSMCESMTPVLPLFTGTAKPECSKTSSSSGNDDDKMTPTAKVSAWLETMYDSTQVDDENEDIATRQVPRDAINVTTTNLGSLHLQPITGEGSSLDSRLDGGRVFSRIQGKAIPPITNAPKGGETENVEGILFKDENNERCSSFCEDDVCTTLATVDSETSSPLLSGGAPDDGEREPVNQESELTKETLPDPAANDIIITVREAGDASQNEATGSKTGKPGVASTSKQDDTEPKASGAGKLSFSGVANTLLQWKLNKIRAEKRRTQSIAIDARHFALMGAISDKIKTQLPRSLAYSLKEEVHPILEQTVQAYRREVGKKHRLTVQAQQRLEELTKELEKPH